MSPGGIAQSAKIAGLTLIGILCVQAAWALVVPPFRGLDEHDHTYKAAAVAAGDWTPAHEPSTQAWGEFVLVPTDLVKAAQPICEDLPYTTPHNCRGIGEVEAGTTRVASSAARYNPAFYTVVGSAALPFQGTSSVYAMRVAGLLMCAVLVALAFAISRNWSRSPWPGVALLCALTPTATYTFSVAAPNGVEMAAGFLLWCTLLGLARHGPTRTTIALGVMGAVPLTVVRGMGPVWLLLIVVTAAVLVPRPRLRHVLLDRRVWLGSGIVLTATLYAIWWTLASRGILVESRHQFDELDSSVIVEQWVLWFFQSVAAFPARDDLAPLALYAVIIVGWWLLLAVAARVGSRRERAALGVVLVCASAIPIVITVLTYEKLGTAWQGRYTYPYAVGFLLICGYALDRVSTPRWARVRWPTLAATAAALVVHLIGQLNVLAGEARTSPLAGTDAWLQPNPATVIFLNLVGFSLLAWALILRQDVEDRPDNVSGWTGSPTTGSTSSGGSEVPS